MTDPVRTELFNARILLLQDPMRDGDAIEPFLAAMAALPPELRPDHFTYGDRRKRKFAAETVRAAVVKTRANNLVIANAAETYAEAWGVSRPAPAGSFELYTPAPHAGPIIEALYSLCRAYAPWWGWAHPRGDIVWNEGLGKFRERKLPPVIEFPAWIHVLGAEQVAAIGEARVAATPAFRVEMLPAGGAVIQATADPLDVQSPAAREALVAVVVHLRPELDGAALLAELRERPAKVAAQRAQEAKTVLVRAPAESMTIAEAPVSDLSEDDGKAAVGRLDNEAERFIAGFHAQIEELITQRKGALPNIDQHFLERDYWKQRGAAQVAKLALGLGAYLGFVLVRELGGHWVPMRDPSQSYVVVGDRAWFPFARVQQYLASQHATREHSLAAYFAAASAQRRGGRPGGRPERG